MAEAGPDAPVAVSILDREFLIACSEAERPGVIAAARHLDAKMREVRAGGRVSGMDRIAVLAALNIAHELLDLQQRDEQQSRQLALHLSALKSKLDGALPGSLQ